jgi:hypothetical protein
MGLSKFSIEISMGFSTYVSIDIQILTFAEKLISI